MEAETDNIESEQAEKIKYDEAKLNKLNTKYPSITLRIRKYRPPNSYLTYSSESSLILKLSKVRSVMTMRIHSKQFPSNPTIHTKEFFRCSPEVVSVVELALNHGLTT
ncbi:hypothetical protein ACTXT7_003878 [Hymenolepis weldensis]